jgi:hypothetical protein
MIYKQSVLIRSRWICYDLRTHLLPTLSIDVDVTSMSEVDPWNVTGPPDLMEFLLRWLYSFEAIPIAYPKLWAS